MVSARTRALGRPTAAIMAALIALAVCLPAAAQQASPARFLGREDILLYGLGLKAEPETQTVPRDIATIVSTFLQAPTLPNGQVPPFAADAEVRAVLRGPSFPAPLEIKAKPNAPLNIPPLTVAGTHTVENIRLVTGGEVLLYGSPESVRIEVIDKLLVTQITARALTADEIREKGIVFDKSNFQAYNFTAAFAITPGKDIKISFPVVLPNVEGPGLPQAPETNLPTVDVPQIRSLQTVIPDTLKLQTQIPNLQVVGFTLKVPTLQGQNFFVPPIPGVIVIPGDIGFLNQYFSVMLMVSNVAPAGSKLVVTDLKATIVLPPGKDDVVGSNDDPLRMAQLAAGEAPRQKLVTQPGPDGKLGTGDDVNPLGPGETGNAEFLVEGRREGSHVVEMALEGTLNGLPVGPVPITGRAAGAVLVRNPKFTLTFTHPDVVNAGEPYALDVTVTNTSEAPANFVSLNLFDNNIAGATLVGDATRQVDYIAPSDSATVTFDLISRVSGRVTAGTLDSDDQVQGRFLLKTAVGELGVPLSPDSLVLPKEANFLPADLRSASLGLLGKAWALATAPPAAVPKDLTQFSRKVVLDRAVEVAAAGLRVSLREPIPDSVSQLMMEFAGSDYARLPLFNKTPDDLDFAQRNFSGFDELRRKSVRGDTFAAVVGRLLGPEAANAGASAFHLDFATRVSYRPPHVSVLAQSVSGPLPLTLRIRDASGRTTGGAGAAGKVVKEVPFSEWMRLTDGGGTAVGQLALVTTPEGDYTIELVPDANAPPDARYTLSLVLPGADGNLRHVVYDGLGLADLPTLDPVAGEPHRVSFAIVPAPAGGAQRGPTSAASLQDPAPSVVSIIQQPDADVLECEDAKLRVGRVVAVLFSEEVTAASVQDKLKPNEITNYGIDGNKVVGVALQPGRRIAFLALRDPVGRFVQSSITFNGVADLEGNAIEGLSAPIEATLDDEAGLIRGQVLRADGTAVEYANVRLFYQVQCGEKTVTFGVSSKNADGQGRFGWDFVLRDPTIVLYGADEESGEARQIYFKIARDGQTATPSIVFLGRGTLEGRTLLEDGVTPVKDAYIRVTSLTDQSTYGARTDENGRFTIPRLPVGNILIEAVDLQSRSTVFISELIPTPGAVVQRDIVLLALSTPPNVEVKYGALTARALRADGTTPVVGASVVAWYQNNSQPGVACPKPGKECPVAKGTSDASGQVLFEKIVAGSLRVEVIDQQLFQEGEASTIVPADGTAQVNVLFVGGLGTVRGVVLDPNGAPVAGARVGGGLSLTTTDALGRFALTDVPVGNRNIVAVSDALATTGSANVDLLRAGDEINVTIVLEGVGAIAGVIYAPDGQTPQAGINVYVLKSIKGGYAVPGQAVTDEQGRYRIDGINLGDYKVSAFAGDFSTGNIVDVSVNYFRQVVRADVVFRGGGGTVRGVIYDEDGQTPLKAAASISGDQVVVAGGRVGVGFQYVQNYRIVQTGLDGKFSFSGLLAGKFTVRAAGQFSPDPISYDGEIQPNQTIDLRLALQPKSAIRGVLFEPDGVTPVAGKQVPVTFKSNSVKVFCTESSLGETKCTSIPQGIQELTVVTNDVGEFSFPIVNAGPFTLTAADAATGRTGQIRGTVRAGDTAVVDFRLVGLGAVTVRVYAANRDAAGNPIPVDSARVEVAQMVAPQKRASGVTGADGSVRFGGGDAFGEGAFVVTASKSGYAGRAQGKVAFDGENITVTVFLADSSGSVSGQVFRADGITAVPNAEVTIFSGSQAVAFALTDAEGRYAEAYIPLGAVRVEVFEAASAQRGAGAATIFFNGQDVSVNVRLEELAVVRGTVLQAGTLAPLRGWTVSMSQQSPSGIPLPGLVTTTGVDGSFSFPGAAVGSFALRASRRDVNGTGQASGSVIRPGELVEVPIVVNILRPAAGRVAGAVVNADGSPGANAIVTLNGGLDTTAGEDGTFAFENIPLGRFSVTAKSQVSSDAGSAVGELSFDGATSSVLVTLGGLSAVTGTAYKPGTGGGRVPAANVQVAILTSPSSACGGACTLFTDADGRFAFNNLPAKTFTVNVLDPVTQLRGSAGGTLTTGATTDVEVLLEVAGSVSGRVLSSGGEPKAAIVAQLTYGSRNLFVESDAEGRFTFPTVALATYALQLSDPIGPGVASRQVVVNGAEALGDIALDEAPPGVTQTTPLQGAVAVPLAQAMTIVFSEPVDIGSVSAATLAFSGPAGPLTAIVSLSIDQRTATVQPLAALSEQTRYTLKIAGVKDLAGKAITTPYVLGFTTVDLTPPSIVELSPAPDTSGAPIYSTIRAKFSEPIDPAGFAGAPIAVSQGGVATDGRVDYLFANTVVVFTPNRPFSEDGPVQVVIGAARDVAGNVQPQALSYAFSTTDRTPPVVTSLQPVGGATVIENLQKQIVADVGAQFDVAFVDFFINDQFVAAARTAPFTLTFQAIPGFGKPGDVVRISAIATDTSANRGQVAATTTVTVLADQAPGVAITAPAPGLQARNGDRVNVSVRATDDVGVAQVAFKANTGKTTDAAVRKVDPAVLDRTEAFGFDVPMTAAPGSTIAIEASATDTTGKVVAASPVTVTVLDATKPTVEITGTSSGARVRPGQEVTVVVAAGDLGGVARVGFTASGAASLTETRDIDPAQNSVATSFTFTVSPAATPNDRVSLDAYAVDRAGNRADAARIVLAMADSVPPSVTLRTQTGSLEMVPGRPFTVVAEASDETGVSRITLTGSGAFTVTDAKSLAPPTTPVSTTFTVNVPSTVTAGQTLTLRAQSFDLSNNASTPAEITLTARSLSGVTLPGSVIVLAGESATATATLADPAPAVGLVLGLSSSQPLVASVPATISFAPGETTKTFAVAGVSGGTATISAFIDGVQRASMTATVRGGVVRGTVTHQGQPVAGAPVTIQGSGAPVATTTAGDGTYFVEGVGGGGVTVLARNADGSLQGEATAPFNRPGGFVVVDVVLVQGSTVRGTVRRADGTTPAGQGVKVELFEKNAQAAMASTFTDADSAYRFALVPLGQYIVVASDLAGNRGRATIDVISGGQDLQVPIAYLGRGTVRGVVRDAGGAAVPNVPVTFRASSVFGAAPEVRTNADEDGRFEFTGVFVGSFSVDARDPVTGTGGMTSGAISADGQAVEIEVKLSAVGNIAGTIFRADGITPVGAGVSVSTSGRSTITDPDGRYLFEFLPLNGYSINVYDASSRARGIGSTTLATNGETKTVNVTLAGQGTLVVTVRDSAGNLVEGASVGVNSSNGVLGDSLSGTTAADGTVVFERLLAGTFSTSARKGSLVGSATGSFQAGEVKAVSVQFNPPAPTGAVTGTVFRPNGQSPATAGRVTLGGRQVTLPQDGTFRFDGLPLGVYELRAYDENNVLRAKTGNTIVLNADGQVATRDVTFVALGSVTGTVFYPDGSSAAGLGVSVVSNHPEFGGAATVFTNTGGVYRLANVAAGDIVASTQAPLLGFLGQNSGRIVDDGDVLVLDIVMGRDTVLPSASITGPAVGASVTPGQAFTVSASASDNVGIVEVTLATSGVYATTQTRTANAIATFNTSFSVTVPAGTPPGTMTLSVRAKDSNGNLSPAVTRDVTVLDTGAPVVAITAPAANAEVDPRTPVAVTVQASDPGGVARVTLNASGSATAALTRDLQPPQNATTQAFEVAFTTLPETGGSLTLNASARDAAGNAANAAQVTVRVRDVVAPRVTSVSPANGATGVDPQAVVTVSFSEPMARATLTGANVQLLRGGTAVAAAVIPAADDRSVTLAPSAALALNTFYTVAVGVGATDVAGNGLAAQVTSTFKTASPDVTPPRVSSISPAAGAVDVSLTAPITVTFTEAVDPATVTGASFRVTVSGSPLAGTRVLLSGNTAVRFTATDPLPAETVVATELTDAITDVYGNPLADANGNPLTAPLTFTFLTGAFGITSPRGDVTENSQILLQASASAGLGVSTVVFTVNGTALPAVSGPNYQVPFTVPALATAQSLTIVASGRNASNVEVATATRTVSIVFGLKVTPRLVGVEPGRATPVTFYLSSAADAPVTIGLAPAVSGIFTVPASATIEAGASSVDVPVTGVALGNTTLLATSSRGNADAIVSVSQVPPQQARDGVGVPVGTLVLPPISLGSLVVAPAGTVSPRLVLLKQPAGTPTTVQLASGNTDVVTVPASATVPAGEVSVVVPITAGVAGTATITLRFGDQMRQLTVHVGTPPADAVPPAVSTLPAGVLVLPPLSLGTVFAPVSSAQTLGILFLPAASGSPTTVLLSSSDPAVAAVPASITISAGERVAQVPITAGTAGTATITLRAGDVTRVLTVVVGTPSAERLPPGVAQPVGVMVLPPLALGTVFTPVSGTQTVGLLVYPAGAPAARTLLLSSSDPAVASVPGSILVAAGQKVVQLPITAGGSTGEARITLLDGTIAREFTVIAGTPPADRVPPAVAQPVGTMVLPLGAPVGYVVTPVGGNPVVSVQLVAAPAATDTPVTVTSDKPGIATVGSPVVLHAGERVVPLSIAAGSQSGITTLTLQFGNEKRTVVVVVGTPPADALPAPLAPVVGVKVNP